MATVHNIQYPTTQFNTQILGRYNNFMFGGGGGGGGGGTGGGGGGGVGGDGAGRGGEGVVGGIGGDSIMRHRTGHQQQKSLRLTLPIIEYGEEPPRGSPRGDAQEDRANTPQKVVTPRRCQSVNIDNSHAHFDLPADVKQPPRTAEPYGKTSGPMGPPFTAPGTRPTTQGSTAHLIYKQYQQLFKKRNCWDKREARYADATKNSKMLVDFPGVNVSGIQLRNRQEDRQKEKKRNAENSGRISSSGSVNRRDVRWYPHISETFDANWDRTFTYTDSDVTFRERQTGSPSRVMSTVIQLPTIFSEKTSPKDRYIVKWLHSVPDYTPYANTICNSALGMTSATPLSLKTVDSYFQEPNAKGKPSLYSH